MNLPNKITHFRIVLAFIIIAILLFPFDEAGINVTQLFVNEKIVIDLRYLVVGILFIIGSISDFADGYIAQSNNQITDYGKIMDDVADKILVNGVLVILAAQGFVHPIIPVVVIIRDVFVDSIKKMATKNETTLNSIGLEKGKTVCLMTGVALTLFYNMPFELINLRIADFLLILGAVLAIISAIQHYNSYKKIIFNNIN